MANEGKVSKRVVSARAEIELCKKVETKYSRHDDKDKTIAFIRALEDATRDVVLTAKQWEEIALEVKENEKKRVNKRMKKIGVR